MEENENTQNSEIKEQVENTINTPTENTSGGNVTATKNEEKNNDYINSNDTSEINYKTQDLKGEATNTVNEVKQTFKNANFKKDSKEAQGFFTSFFKDPLGQLKKGISSSGNKLFKIAIIILAVWLISIFIYNIFSIASRYLFTSYGSFQYFFRNFFKNILNLVKDLVTPIISVSLLSGLVYAFKKNKNKSFLNIASGILVAKVPVVLACVMKLLTIISSSFSVVVTTFTGYCSILSTVLLYFAIKYLSEEDKNDSYFWKFALIIGIYYIVKFIFSYLGIYL